MLSPDLILWAWLVVCVVVFWRKSPTWGVAKTTAVLLVLGTLLLPAQHRIKPPLLPYLDKHAFTLLGPYVAILWFHRPFWRERAQGTAAAWITVAVAASLAATMWTNREPIQEGAFFRPGLPPLAEYRVELLTFMVYFTLPFALGQRVFRRPEELRVLMVAIVAGLVAYWLLILLEVRVSPQLHKWVYGYHPFSFSQAMRAGGFRPSVFFNHGLTLAMYQTVALLFAIALYKADVRIWRLSGRLVFLIGVGVLVMCRSKGALVYLVVFAPAVYFLKPRGQLALACVCAAIVLVYPLLRANDLIDDEGIIEFANAQFGEERAESLAFRLRTESALFERAMEKPWFGWGGDSRSLIGDPITGKVVSIPDGDWIIQLGKFGAFGFCARMGLFVLALWAWLCHRKHIADTTELRLVAALGLAVGMYMLDQLPNSISYRLPLIYAGAAYAFCRSNGCVEGR